jgi:prepilin-type N-terminal cleavage/methylation domain-containing protein
MNRKTNSKKQKFPEKTSRINKASEVSLHATTQAPKSSTSDSSNRCSARSQEKMQGSCMKNTVSTFFRGRQSNTRFGEVSQGFTLLEMLVVIFIIGLIATIAILNYTQIRRETSQKLITDEIISLFNQTRDNSRFGRTTGDKKNPSIQCWHLKFEQSKITQQSSKFTDQRCETTPLTIHRTIDLNRENMEVKAQKEITLRFTPPKGTISGIDKNEATIEIGFKNSEETKSLKINKISATMSRE